MSGASTPTGSDPPTWRPPGHPADKPWPPKLRDYPLDHPARRNEESKQAFNWDWAVEDFGETFMSELRTVQNAEGRAFRGDWWMLALLKQFERVASARDPDAMDPNRWMNWDQIRRTLRNLNISLHLECAYLFQANLRHIILQRAHLEHADLRLADLERADFIRARLEHSKFFRTNLHYCHFEEAHLFAAELYEANLYHTKFKGVNLTAADLRGCRGLRFDANRVRDIHIEGDAPDPWSVLRRSYTGPWFFVHLGLLLAFVLPYVGKVLALTAADHAGRMLGSAAHHLPHAIAGTVRVEHVPAWRVLVGLDRGWWVPALAATLLIYNIIRGVLTIKVGQLRDAEERSGITPRLEEYMGTQGLKDEGAFRCVVAMARHLWLWLVVTAIGVGSVVFVFRVSMRALEGRFSDSSEATDLFVLISFIASVGIGFGNWLGVRSLVLELLKIVNRLNMKPQLIDLNLVGLWRLHRIQQVLLWIALLSVMFHMVLWLWTTTVPEITPPPAAVSPASPTLPPTSP